LYAELQGDAHGNTKPLDFKGHHKGRKGRLHSLRVVVTVCIISSNPEHFFMIVSGSKRTNIRNILNFAF